MDDLLKELEAVVLLPCPFCGTDDHETSPWPSGTEWVCNCGNPDCAVEVTAETPQEAVAKWNTRTHHAEIAEAVKLARGEREEAWEIWQDDMCVAGSDSISDAKHYLMMYGQDGPVRLVRVVSYRETITQEQIDVMHNSAREDGE